MALEFAHNPKPGRGQEKKNGANVILKQKKTQVSFKFKKKKKAARFLTLHPQSILLVSRQVPCAVETAPANTSLCI